MSKHASKGSWARVLGHSFAYLQDGIDTVVGGSFSWLKRTAKKPLKERDKNESKYVYFAKRTGRSLGMFIGNLGDSYFKKYTELKKKK